MPYCPNCQNEYVEGVAHCTDCGGELIAKPTPEQLEDPAHPNYQFELLSEGQDEVVTRILEAELEAAEIPCVISGDAQSTVQIYAAHDARIWVPQRHLDRAREILDSVLNAPPLEELPMSDDVAICDNCGAEIPADAAVCPECQVTFENKEPDV